MDDMEQMFTTLGVKEAENAVEAATGSNGTLGVVMIKREQLRVFANVYYMMKGRVEDLINKQITTGAVNMTPPVEGSLWEHYGGAVYTVLFVANMNPHESVKNKYPPTVVYQNVTNGKRYSGPLSDWHRRMRWVDINDILSNRPALGDSDA